MAQIPTTLELFNDIKQNLETELGFNIPVFGKIFLNALAGVQAAKLKLYWLAIAQVQKNIWVDTADPVAIGGTLERFGLIKIGRAPFPPTQGQYTVEVNGDVSAVIPSQSVFKSDDSSSNPGKLFILDTEFTILTQPDTIVLRALEAGAVSRLTVADTLTATSPLLNVTDQVSVTVEDVIPLSGEDIEAYRDLVVRAFQLESQGGAATDYRAWAADAQGVRFVFPFVKSGECSEINLFIEANQVDSTDGKGTPTVAIKDEVEEVVEFDPDTTRPTTERGRRPLQATVFFLDITPKDVIIIFVGSTNIDTALQTTIKNALVQEIDNIRPFIEAADIESNKNDVLDINTVISIAQELLSSGQSFDSVTMTVDAVPITTSILFENGDIPFLDPTDVTFP